MLINLLMSHLYHLLSYIPLSFLYILSSLISKLLPHVYRRNVVKKNLVNSFPKISKFELDKLISNFYAHFCDVFFETIKSYSISTKELKKRVFFSNFDELNHKLEKEEKVLVLASHQCNWEWLLLASQLNLNQPLNVIYKSISSRNINKALIKSRSRFGSKLIESKKALLHIRRNIKKIGIIAVVADQSPIKKNKKSWRILLNQDTAFFKSVEYLPRLLNSHVYFASMERLSRGNYSVKFDLISTPNQNLNKDILSEYVRKLEDQIKQKPDEWLWTHKRWKYTREDI